MNNILSEILDFAAIEEIIYSECSRVEKILGAHITDRGVLVQTFIPHARKVELLIDKQKNSHPMELVNENGFFAILLNRKTLFKYNFIVTYDNGETLTIKDPYSFPSLYTTEDIDRFERGIHYDIFELMGAHRKNILGVDGTYFSVYAPAAIRVSVVGNFNNWDGRAHQMRKLGACGIYDIFIPGLGENELYKFELKSIKGELLLKADPYAFYSELRPNNANLVYNLDNFTWHDETWLNNRDTMMESSKDGTEYPLNIYEVHLGSWLKKEREKDENGNDIFGSEFYNYRDIAKKIAKYVKSMGYTHIELLPIMEHPLDESWGYQVTGYYAPSSRYGTPHDFMYFIDYMHKNNIGVIIDWVPAHFPKDLHGLGRFDGSSVYEHADPRQGMHPHWGTYIYNYGRPQVSNFLIANALYWAKYYHIDGIRMDAVASMLYLDYGKEDGGWVANNYGGKENLEAIEFLKHLNSIFKQKYPSAIMIAEESTAWPKISGDLNDNGLGFDYKWNMGWMNDFLRYMQHDPLYRSYHYGDLTFSMVYQYSENFILVFSHDEVVHLKGSLLTKMPGATQEEKFANLRVALGFMMTHPGKKLLFMGQEFGQGNEWNEHNSLEWNLLDYDIHKKMQLFTKELNKFYLNNKQLWELDSNPDGFRWVDCHSYQQNIIAFLRNSKDGESLFVVANFTPVVYENFNFNLPFEAKLSLVFNTDKEKYGGNTKAGHNYKLKTTTIRKNDNENEVLYQVGINIPGMSLTIFKVERIL